MPATNKKTLRIEVDSHSVREAVASAAMGIWQRPGIQTAAQVAAFGGAVYGGAQLLNSGPAQQLGGWIGNAGGFVRDATGFSSYEGPRSMRGNLSYPTMSQRAFGDPEGYSGRNMLASEGIYYGHRDMAQRMGAGVGGVLAGTLPALGTIGLMQMGALSSLGNATKLAGSTIGGGLASSAVGLLGDAVAAPLGRMGLGGAQKAVLGATGASGLIAQGGAKVGGALGGFIGMTLPWTILNTLAMRGGEAVVENIATQRQAEDWMDQTSYKYTYGGASNTILGRGFDYRTQRDIAEAARRTLTDHTFMRQTDFQEVFRGIQMSELDFNVRSAEEFKEKFAKVTEVLADIARTFETTLEGATQMLGTMQQSGFYSTADQVSMLWRNNAIARNSAMAPEQMAQIGIAGAEQAGSYGVSRSFGAELRTSAAGRLARTATYLDGAEEDRYERYLYELGGAETVSGDIADIVLRNMQTNTTMQHVLYALADTDNMQIDRDTMRKFQAGEFSLVDLMEMGGSKATANQRAFEKFLNESTLYLGELSGQESIDFFRQMVLLQHAQSPAEDIATTLASQWGVDNQMLRYVIKEAFFSNEMRSEGSMQLDEIARLTMNQEALARTPRGWWERNIANPLSQLGHRLGGTGISSWFMQMSEDFQNEFIYQIDKVDVTRDDLSLEGVRTGRNALLAGERIRDSLPTRHETQAIIDEIAEAIQGAIETTLVSGDGNVIDLESSKAKVEELQASFNKLFMDFESGKVTVEGFTSTYSAAIRELQQVATGQGLTLSSAIGDISQTIGTLSASFAESPGAFNSAYDAAELARSAGLHRLASQYASGDLAGGDPRVNSMFQGIAARNYRAGGTSLTDHLFSMGVNAMTDEEYATMLEQVTATGVSLEGMGMERLQEGDLSDVEMALLDEIFANPETRKAFANIGHIDQGMASRSVNRFLEQTDYKYAPLFKALERLESQNLMRFNTGADGERTLFPNATRFTDLQAHARSGWSPLNSLGFGYETTIMGREALAEDVVRGAVYEVGGYDAAGLDVVREYLKTPFETTTIGTPGMSVDRHSMNTAGLVEALAAKGITDTKDVERYVELWSKGVAVGTSTGVYDPNIDYSTPRISVMAAQSFESNSKRWLKELVTSTGVRSAGEVGDIAGIFRDAEKREILRQALFLFDPATGKRDDAAYAALVEAAGNDPEMVSLIDALSIEGMDPEKRSAQIGALLGLGVEASTTGLYATSDILRQTFGYMAAGIEKYAEGERDPQKKGAFSKSAANLRKFSTQIGVVDLTPLHDTDLIDTLVDMGQGPAASVITQSMSAAAALAGVGDGGAGFTNARDKIIKDMIDTNIIDADTAERFNLGVLSKDDFIETTTGIFHAVLNQEFVNKGTTPLGRNINEELLGTNISTYMQSTSRAITESGRAVYGLDLTLRNFESTMAELNRTMSEVRDKL